MHDSLHAAYTCSEGPPETVEGARPNLAREMFREQVERVQEGLGVAQGRNGRTASRRVAFSRR